jgi:hypothetical protein
MVDVAMESKGKSAGGWAVAAHLGVFMCDLWCVSRSSTKGTISWAFLHGLSSLFLPFLHTRNGVPSFETIPKGILQE